MPKHTREKQVEVLTALQVNGGNVRKAAREYGVSKTTLTNWTKQAKAERLALATSGPLADTGLVTTGQTQPAAPPELLPYTPEPTEPLWYEVECQALGIVQRKVAALTHTDGDYTVQDLKQLAQIAQIAHTIRTGQDRLGTGNTTVQVAVVWQDKPRPGDTLPHAGER